VSCEDPILSRFSSGTHTTTVKNGRSSKTAAPIKKRWRKRTAHPGTLTSQHARNRVLKHQPARPLLALCLPNNHLVALLVHKAADGSSKRASGSEEHVRERLAAAYPFLPRAHDVARAKVGKDVLQMRRLALKAASRGAGGDGDGDVVGGEVGDEPRDAREELDVRPASVLCCVALGEVVVDRERDVGEEGEQMG